MQNVLLPGGSEIWQGTQVVGRLVKLVPESGNAAAEMILAFDSIRLENHKTPLHTSLRALASNLEVADAETPKYFDDTAPSSYGIGGEVVYRGGGHVMNGLMIVGEPVHGGVLSRTRPNLDKGCRGTVAGKDQPQSLWIFSSDACGAYGYPHLAIAHAGRNDPQGEIVLTSASDRSLKVRRGTAMLLRVL